MSSRPLQYASAGQRPPNLWRIVLQRVRRVAPYGVIALILLALLFVSQRWPWLWYGSRDRYQWHRWLTFRMPAEQVVYEEDAKRATILLAKPHDPEAAYVGNPIWLKKNLSDYVRTGRFAAGYSPPAFRALERLGEPLLSFMHERVGASGHQCLVVVKGGIEYAKPSAHSTRERASIWLTGVSYQLLQSNSPIGGEPVDIALSPQQVMRLYAGQADPLDGAHFTIKYEIDNVRGTIDGRVEADDRVTLKILNGPGATRSSTAPWP